MCACVRVVVVVVQVDAAEQNAQRDDPLFPMRSSRSVGQTVVPSTAADEGSKT